MLQYKKDAPELASKWKERITIMKYGLQLYSVRDLAEVNYEAALRAVAEMGYDMVEPAGFFNNSAEDVAAMLKHYGLTACSTHTGVKHLAPDVLNDTIAYHKTIGCQNLIIPAAKINTAEEVTVLVDLINRVQPILAAEGIQLHYHNHSREFRPNLDGLIVEEELAARTNVKLQIDTFWAFNAGLRAIDVMEKYKDRIDFIHLKDGIPQNWADPESLPVGKSVGSGEAPVLEVRKKAIEMGVKIVIESEGLDPTGPEEAKRCIDFLRAVDAKEKN